jgi:Family of unknown function (DUF6787)
MLDKLKKRWGIESSWQVLVIFFVFAITGSSSMYVSKFFFDLFGINESTSFFVKTIIYILTVLPAYQILLLFWGTVLGQGKFFRNFLKKLFSRIIPTKLKTQSSKLKT